MLGEHRQRAVLTARSRRVYVEGTEREERQVSGTAAVWCIRIMKEKKRKSQQQSSCAVHRCYGAVTTDTRCEYLVLFTSSTLQSLTRRPPSRPLSQFAVCDTATSTYLVQQHKRLYQVLSQTSAANVFTTWCIYTRGPIACCFSSRGCIW